VLSWYYFFGLVWFFGGPLGLTERSSLDRWFWIQKDYFFWLPNRRHKKQISTPVGPWRI
jgi:hypothetical protein